MQLFMHQLFIRYIKAILSILLLFLMCLFAPSLKGQELDCSVKVNHSQVQGTNKDVFESLENDIAEFMNNRSWTTCPRTESKLK